MRTKSTKLRRCISLMNLLHLQIYLLLSGINTLPPYGIPNANQYIAIGFFVVGLLIVSNQHRLKKCIKPHKKDRP